jgi:hypothetical protein
MTKNTKLILAGLACVVSLGLLAWTIYAGYTAYYVGSSETEEDETTNTLPSANLKPVETVKTTPKTVTTKKPLTYSEVIKLYEGARFQFSGNCTQVTPASFVLKKGEKFMIDNLDTITHVFGVSGQKYTLKAHTYAIATATTAGNVPVLCDNVARATVKVSP